MFLTILLRLNRPWREIKKHGLENEIEIVTTGCNGFCETGPLLLVKPDNIYYNHLKVEDIPFLVEEHLLKGRPVKKFMHIPPAEEGPIPKLSDIDFFKKQILIALRNWGLIDAEKIDDYIARDGYKALTKALTEMKPEEIIQEIKKAGLRGRGGAGFPTGLKWELVRKAEGRPKYIVCNGDEGDPGAYMDRSIIESDPHSILEGMLIGARAIGSEQGFIYIRNEYPLALKRMNTAIEQAREYGLIGKDILGTGFNFEVKVVRGAGAFVCGEETSLMASIEGRLGEPRGLDLLILPRAVFGVSQPTSIMLRLGPTFRSLLIEELNGILLLELKPAKEQKSFLWSAKFAILD